MNNLEISDAYKPVLEKVKKFIAEEVDPVTMEYHAETEQIDNRWTYTARQEEIREGLKDKARAAKLLNFFLPDAESPDTPKITNLDYAYMAEAMGPNALASEVFNCSAPDTGNMEVLERYGTEAQKKNSLSRC